MIPYHLLNVESDLNYHLLHDERDVPLSDHFYNKMLVHLYVNSCLLEGHVIKEILEQTGYFKYKYQDLKYQEIKLEK